MDYYSTLGLQRGASDADIKKAYRTMAMKHHPDRGGDEIKFKEISQAYEFLTDPQKKQMIDSGIDPNSPNQGFGGFNHHQGGNPFEFHFGAGDVNDFFNNFGFGGFGQPRSNRNRSLNIQIEITLEDVLRGKDINAEVGIPGGPKKMVNISIPPGIETGQQIRYDGMGDSSIPHMRPGDLIVNIIVRPHPVFRREGISLIYDHHIDVWDAVLGSGIDIRTLDNKQLKITVPPGTQPDTVLSCRGEGLPDVRSRQRGNLLIRIKVDVPRNLTPEQLAKVQKLKNEL
jgi:DnaJ-class molecular chaperone